MQHLHPCVCLHSLSLVNYLHSVPQRTRWKGLFSTVKITKHNSRVLWLAMKRLSYVFVKSIELLHWSGWSLGGDWWGQGGLTIIVTDNARCKHPVRHRKGQWVEKNHRWWLKTTYRYIVTTWFSLKQTWRQFYIILHSHWCWIQCWCAMSSHVHTLPFKRLQSVRVFKKLRTVFRKDALNW